ncbi:MAG TPA: DsrE family protein [Burkholderiales bacterium]|nr:DsrE family protein [Burkholderiales bacterium]
MKATRILAALLLAAAALSPFAVHADKGGRHQIVIQVTDNDPAKWNLALNVAQNLQQAYGKDKTDVEIVAYGPGLNMFKSGSTVAKRLNAAQDASVALYACENTMQKMKVTTADLHPGSVVAPGGGVVHVFKRQREGWDTIRP